MNIIAIGTLCELVNIEDGDYHQGVRLYVVYVDLHRDEALYALSPWKYDTIQRQVGFMNDTWVHGIPLECLQVVEPGSPAK